MRLPTTKLAVLALAAATALAACAGASGDPSATPTSVNPTAERATARATAGPTPAAPTATPHTVALIDVPQISGDPRENVPSALENMVDPAFPEPLVDPARIRSGGPPPDGIPPLDAPRFESAADVTWLEDVEPVLSLVVDGQARAYPIQIMTWHEIVNDTFGDTPVTVSYCPLCNSAIAYVRRIDARTFDFGTSGRLFNSSLVMYDRQTQSLWSHFTGQAVVGALTGLTLDTLPVSTVSWETFRTAHPDGLVLSRVTGFARSYGINPYPGYDDVNRQPFLFDGEVDGRLAAQTRVIAIRGTTETIAIVQDDLASVGVMYTTVDEDPVVVLLEPGTASALDTQSIAEGRDVGAVGVFRPLVDGVAVDLVRQEGGGFVDRETGSVFDILGRATDGALGGSELVPVEHLDTFWFAIAAFEPDTRIVTG